MAPTTGQSASSPSLEALLADARAGSKDAAGEVVQRLLPYLLAIASREIPDFLRAKQGGSDLVQEACLVAGEKLRDFPGRSEAELRAWMRDILSKKLAHFFRKYEAEKRCVAVEVSIEGVGGATLSIPDDASSPSAQVRRRETQAEVGKKLSLLPDRDQQLLRWRYFDGLTLAQIGDQLKMTPPGVSKALEKAESRLVALYDPDSDREGLAGRASP